MEDETPPAALTPRALTPTRETSRRRFCQRIQREGIPLARYGQASFGKLPRFREFLRDSQEIGRGVVIGQPGADQQLEKNKQDFTAAWVARPEFVVAFGAMSEAQFVDALFTNAGVTPTEAVRDALVGGLLNQTETRAGVLRASGGVSDWE